MADDLPSLALGAALAGTLVFAAIGDWRTRIIPNRLNLAIAVAAPLWWLAQDYGLAQVGWQLALAAAVFAAFALAFALGGMGGGDVKLLTALALWFPLDSFVGLLVVMSLLGGALTIAMLLRQRWQRSAGRPEVPYGIAIALAGMWSLSRTVF